MATEYEWDIYRVFREQIEDSLPQLEIDISNLYSQKNAGEAIDNLFRAFHNFKATADYLSLKPLKELSHRAETVLSTLREDKRVVEESIIEWILDIRYQLEAWLEEMNKEITNLQAIPKHLERKMKVTKSYINPADKLRTLSLLYIDDNIDTAKDIIIFLEKILKKVKLSTCSDSKEILKNYDIIITNLGKASYSLLQTANTVCPSTPIISIFRNVDTSTIKKLITLNITHSISGDLTEDKIQRELYFVTKTFFSSRNILFDNKKINSFIKTLKPLSNTIFKISEVCDDDEMSIHDLINVVKQDPIITANILKYATSPLYDSSLVTTIDKAITRLGKRIVKALALSEAYKNIQPIELDAYKINEDIFSKISMTRLSLMLKWYSKVNIADLSLLSSTSLLSNIGQLLISKELNEIGQDDAFIRVAKELGIKFAEESILHTSTPIVSAQILNYWKLSGEIVDIITYNDKPNEAPQNIKSLAVANHIVTSLVDLQCNIAKELPSEIVSLMKENDLDTKPLLKALNSITSLS